MDPVLLGHVSRVLAAPFGRSLRQGAALFSTSMLTISESQFFPTCAGVGIRGRTESARKGGHPGGFSRCLVPFWCTRQAQFNIQQVLSYWHVLSLPLPGQFPSGCAG